MSTKVRKVDKVVLFWINQKGLDWPKKCGWLNKNIQEKVRNKMEGLKVSKG